MNRPWVVSLALLACQPTADLQAGDPYQVSVTVPRCAAFFVSRLSLLRARVSGPGLEGAYEATAVPGQVLTLPPLPVGTRRVVEVLAYEGTSEAGYHLVAVGRSRPFDVSFVPAEAELTKTVMVREIDRWVQPQGGCEQRIPRAAHTATLLPDGRVFVAGGFNMTGSANRIALSQTEYFDPALGEFSSAPALGFTNRDNTRIETPKAFHTATATSFGVLLWGGESYSGQVVSPRSEILVFDAEVNDATGGYAAVVRRAPAPVSRTRHLAALDGEGRVIVLGGVRSTATGRLVPIDEIEVLDPRTAEPTVMPNAFEQRVDSTATRVGELIAVAGGSDGTQLLDSVTFYRPTGTTLSLERRVILTSRRQGAVAVPFGEGLVVVGGQDERGFDLGSEFASSTGTVTPISGGPVGKVCAVSLGAESLLAIQADGRVINVRGGQAGPSTTEWPRLPRGRELTSCTVLDDGSVLVSGGQAGAVLSDAWWFTPKPLE